VHLVFSGDDCFSVRQGTLLLAKKSHVPGFYDGDGKGGLDGVSGKYIFRPTSRAWSFKTVSNSHLLDGKAGRFTVVEVSAEPKGFWKGV